MLWLHFVGWFFGGALLANALPHLLSGVLGHFLPSPFASPPFKGLSSPVVNTLWGLANVALSYVLLARVGAFEARSLPHAGVFFVGFSLMALQCARALGRLRLEAEDGR